MARLSDLTWQQAEPLLAGGKTVVVPIGAAAKEHGHHLPLGTDWILAEYLADRVDGKADVLIAPVLTYGYYPAFVEYPGSVSLERDVFERTVRDVARSFHRHGTRRIYFLNTGLSTNMALEPARLSLAGEGVVMEYTRLGEMLESVESSVAEQPRGTHADEIETSMMLYIAPDRVKMELARPELAERQGPGPLTRDPNASRGIYSPTGSWGDPTLATVEKGRVVVEALVEGVIAEIEDFCQEDFEAAPAREAYL